jgi:hypothetical protein
MWQAHSDDLVSAADCSDVTTDSRCNEVPEVRLHAEVCMSQSGGIMGGCYGR